MHKTEVTCLGAGYVVGPTMAIIAAKCPDIEVTVVDPNEARIAAWNSDRLTVYEPGLDEVVREARGRNLHSKTDGEGAIRAVDMSPPSRPDAHLRPGHFRFGGRKSIFLARKLSLVVRPATRQP